MKNRCLSILLLVFISACTEKINAQSIPDDTNIEVTFNTRNSGAKYPEYELTFLSGSKVIAKRVYKNGKLIASKGKIPDGKVVEKYVNGKIKNIINYRDGKREGKAVGFYKNGKVKIVSTYKEDNPTGVIKLFYETGQLKSESEIANDKIISYKEYYKNGKLKENVYYKNGEGISRVGRVE